MCFGTADVNMLAVAPYYAVDVTSKVMSDTNLMNSVVGLGRVALQSAHLYYGKPVCQVAADLLKNINETMKTFNWVSKATELVSGKAAGKRPEDRIQLDTETTIPNVVRIFSRGSLMLSDILGTMSWLASEGLPVLATIALQTANIPVLGLVATYALVNLNTLRTTTAIIGTVLSLADCARDMSYNGVSTEKWVKVLGEVAKLVSTLLANATELHYKALACIATATGALTYLGREMVLAYR